MHLGIKAHIGENLRRILISRIKQTKHRIKRVVIRQFETIFTCIEDAIADSEQFAASKTEIDQFIQLHFGKYAGSLNNLKVVKKYRSKKFKLRLPVKQAAFLNDIQQVLPQLKLKSE